jgi:hypothetical protein
VLVRDVLKAFFDEDERRAAAVLGESSDLTRSGDDDSRLKSYFGSI